MGSKEEMAVIFFFPVRNAKQKTISFGISL